MSYETVGCMVGERNEMMERKSKEKKQRKRSQKRAKKIIG